jgi:chromosome partitioning protein
MTQPLVIVVGNEKGGAGKSTLAIHIAVGLMHAGHRTAIIDLDLRQRSMSHFFANRAAWTAANGHTLPMPVEPDLGDGKALARAPEDEQVARFEAAYAEAQGAGVEAILIDTPGGDTVLSRLAHARADQIITPMNDSFVDFDLLGQVDPVTLDLIKPSIYSESVWEARKQRAVTQGRQATIDWLVVTNRLAVAEARNRRRLEERMDTLAKRVGFRVGPGLRDRVIYRELFPFGLTVADLSPEIRPVAVSLAHVAARQEMRNLMLAMGLEGANIDGGSAGLDVAA